MVAAILLGIVLCPRVGAQLRPRIWAKHDVFLTYEHIDVTLQIRNDTGNDLCFQGQDLRDSIIIRVSNRDGDEVSPTPLPLDLGEVLRLGAGVTREMTFAINKHFLMQNEGVYTIQAFVSHPRLNFTYPSKQIRVEVRSGIRVWHHRFGVPTLEEDEPIPMRMVTLVMLPQTNRPEVYCLRVEDAKQVFRVVRLAPKIQGATPQCDVDAIGNIHVFLRIRSDLFMYRVFDSRGGSKRQEFYAIGENAPRLYRDKKLGVITVIGGRRAVEDVDYTLEGGEGESPVPGVPAPPESPAAAPGSGQPEPDIHSPSHPLRRMPVDTTIRPAGVR